MTLIEAYRNNRDRFIGDSEMAALSGLSDGKAVHRVRQQLIEQGHTFEMISSSQRVGYKWRLTRGVIVCADPVKEPIDNQRLHDIVVRVRSELTIETIAAVASLNSLGYWKHSQLAKLLGCDEGQARKRVSNMCANNGLTMHTRHYGENREHIITGEPRLAPKKQVASVPVSAVTPTPAPVSENISLLNGVFR